ncbi:MAG TPA: MFS transporter [Solirubrobacterales bacterium]|nr:MFS transporter [Solirubrobacterales bacterium]
MSKQGPLADSYPAAVALVILALTPFLVLTSAVSSLNELIGRSVHLSEAELEMTAGMANAAYCFGTVLSIQLITRLRPRRVLAVLVLAFVLASIAAAWAPSAGPFVAGRVIQGLATSMMLIAAVPPLVIGWPKARQRWTAMTMNLAVFGAVALGPVVGGVAVGLETWRTVFWIVAAFGCGALVLVALTYEDAPAQDPDAPVDVISVTLAAVGTAAAFFGVSEVSAHSFGAPIVLVPLLAGVALIVLLLVHQYEARDALMPVEKLARTIPVAAIVVAMTAAAVSVGLVDLAGAALELRKVDPTHGAMLFWPEFGGAVATAALFGAIYFTRWVPVVAFAGIFVLVGAAAVLSGVATGSDALVLVGSGATGVGVGASVAPALFTTGFTLPSPELPRVFALIELLRGVAAFLAGPLLLHLSETVGASPASGIEAAVWVAFGIALLGAVVAASVWVAGRARLQRPDIDPWLAGDAPAIDTTPLPAPRPTPRST